MENFPCIDTDRSDELALCGEIMESVINYINTNADQIVDNIDQESIDVYIFLKSEFKKSDVTMNPLFQFVFRSFYRLDNAGLTPEFKDEYFKILQSVRSEVSIDILEIVEKLYSFPNRKGQNSLQFSFVTKMINMIDDSVPIYDSEVAKVFNFRPPYHSKGFGKRLELFIEFHQFLKKNYISILENKKLNPAFEKMKKKFKNIGKLPKTKMLDFLIWSAGKVKSKFYKR